jgi:lipid-binding SYLF domain-containing protein
MMKSRSLFLATALAAAAITPVTMPGRAHATAASVEELNRDADQALQMSCRTNPTAAAIGKSARPVLILPNIVKAGFVFGGVYGECVLKQGSKIDGYYNSFTGSWGLQAGAQSYAYVVFLMSDRAINYIHESHGLKIGTGPTVVIVNEDIAKNLSTSTLQDDAYAFIFDQQGLMAGISIEGTKISRVNPENFRQSLFPRIGLSWFSRD